MNEKFYKNSKLYKKLISEKEEVQKHKWIESEKAGHDIGFDRALINWLKEHRQAWSKNHLDEKKQNSKEDNS